MALRNIHVMKFQYFTAPGIIGNNTSPFYEVSPGIFSSEAISFLPTNVFGQCTGYLIPASRPAYETPPNSSWEEDPGIVDSQSKRVFFRSSDFLRFSLIESYFKVTLQGNQFSNINYISKFRNQDWWKKSWVYEDPFESSTITNYDYFLGNLLNYIDINFPKEMTELSLILWMNQIDGTVHIPLVFEGAIFPSYTRAFKTFTR